MTMLRTILLFVFCLSLGASAQPNLTIGKIHWYTDYDQAMKVAKKQNKPLWLHFGEDPG